LERSRSGAARKCLELERGNAGAAHLCLVGFKLRLFLLESSKNELKILSEDRLKSDELIKTLEENRIRLQTELDVIKRDLEERNQDLKKDRIRIENMIRQEEVKINEYKKFNILIFFHLKNHQSKQQILTKSYDELSQECQLLK
jgi:hypothetical protein